MTVHERVASDIPGLDCEPALNDNYFIKLPLVSIVFRGDTSRPFMSGALSSIVGIDLFSGAGGMTLGAKQAGIKVAWAIESDPNAAATYLTNHPEISLVQGDIRSVTSVEVPKSAMTVLFGGPPCQGFSTSNQRTRNSDNERNWLFEEFFRVAEIVGPEWIVFENVRGVVDTERARYVKAVFARLLKMRYVFAYSLLNAADYGVPQERHRFFIVANRLGFMPLMPRATIGKKCTVREAISDLPKLRNGAALDLMKYPTSAAASYAKKLRESLKECSGNIVSKNAPHIVERYKHVPQGGNWEDIPKSMMSNYAEVERCHTGIYRRLKWDCTSVVIGNFRKNMLIHPAQNRTLSVREAARIQSFPDCYKFQGTIGLQQQQVGNAVPPLLAKAVFRSIMEQSRDALS